MIQAVTFLGWLSDAFKELSDLQRLGIKRSRRLNHLGTTFFPLFSCVKAAEAASHGTALQQVAQPMRRERPMRSAVEDDRFMDCPMVISPFPQTKPGFFTPASTWQYYNKWTLWLQDVFPIENEGYFGNCYVRG